MALVHSHVDQVAAHRVAAGPIPNPATMPPLPAVIGRGLRGRCPVCGEGHVFDGYLTVVPACDHCGAPLALARADDAPPWLTILIVGHVVVPLLYVVDQSYAPPLWAMAAIFLPLTTVLALAVLRPVKGAMVGLMLKLGMLKSETDE